MGIIYRGHNLPYLMAVQAHLEGQGIPGMVQDLRSHLGFPDGWSLTVPDSEHARALELVREADFESGTTDPGGEA